MTAMSAKSSLGYTSPVLTSCISSTRTRLPPLRTSSTPPPPNSPQPQASVTMSQVGRNRLSHYSTGSDPVPSRPMSHVHQAFQSSLSYTAVRDFAYEPNHPMHYGPPPEVSEASTPVSERRMSDPSMGLEKYMGWSWSADGALNRRGSDLAAIQFDDGPPWHEDEDLKSPVILCSRHKRLRSASGSLGHTKAKSRDEEAGESSATAANGDPSIRDPRKHIGYYVGTANDGSTRYYVTQRGDANGPEGEYITYPPDEARQSTQASYQAVDQSPRQYADDDADYESGSEVSSAASSPGPHRPRRKTYDQSRYSRDYQFTITSPDEEMHGKAVALYDFESENENELPLVEGQIILVSYRHNQGWLVAKDIKSGESGLVPEAYVRLLRDIEGGMTSLTGDANEVLADEGSPTQAEDTATHPPLNHSSSAASSAANGYHQPVVKVSTFSTSSKDLDPYPVLSARAHGSPPQVYHLHGQRGGSRSGSQANTPTFPESLEGLGRRDSLDATQGNMAKR